MPLQEIGSCCLAPAEPCGPAAWPRPGASVACPRERHVQLVLHLRQELQGHETLPVTGGTHVHEAGCLGTHLEDDLKHKTDRLNCGVCLLVGWL